MKRSVESGAFKYGKFKVLYRYLVRAAMEKRCVPYIELQNVLGVSRQHIGFYAGQIGNYCLERELPLLNALIINTAECTPSDGFDDYAAERDMSWGELLSECWKRYHVASARKAEAKNFSGLESDLDEFLSESS